MRRRAYRADHLGGDLGRFESDHRHVIRREHERDELLMPADDVVAAFAQAALHKVLMDIARLTCLDRAVRTRRSTSDRRSGGGAADHVVAGDCARNGTGGAADGRALGAALDRPLTSVLRGPRLLS